MIVEDFFVGLPAAGISDIQFDKSSRPAAGTSDIQFDKSLYVTYRLWREIIQSFHNYPIHPKPAMAPRCSLEASSRDDTPGTLQRLLGPIP